MDNTALLKVRIDKWLWAARFYKTRSLAKTAIEGGKVHVNGDRIKPSKEIERGVVLRIRLGWDEKEIEVLGLSEQRRGAPEAQQLYQETEDSIKKRTQRAEERKATGSTIKTASKPSGKERRQLDRIKRDLFGDFE